MAAASALELLRSRLRAHFPPLAAAASAAGPVAFLDNAAGTFVPRRVIDAVAGVLATRGVVNSLPGYALGRAQAALKVAAHEATALFLNAPCGAEEIAIGPSATALNFRLAAALARNMRKDDAVVVSELEHECNASPWRDLEKSGCELRVWRARWPAGTLAVEDLEPLLADGRVRLVAVTQASNALGLMTQPALAARVAHKHGALIVVDGVHGAAHHIPDGARDDFDFYIFSPYKILAPHLGVLYMKRAHAAGLDLPTLTFYDKASVSKFELGTAQYEALAGWIASLEYIARDVGGAPEGAPLTRAALEAGFRQLEALEQPTKLALLRGLAAIRGVSVYGSLAPEDRVGTVAFNVVGVSPAAVALELGEKNICVGNGHFYALLPVGALGLLEGGGVVRASIAHYNSPEDVQRLLDGVAAIAAAAAAAAAAPAAAIVHDAAKGRFEAELGAHLDYEILPDAVLNAKSTFLPPEARGRGLGAKLTRAALDFAAERKLRVRASCSFVQAALEKGVAGWQHDGELWRYQ